MLTRSPFSTLVSGASAVWNAARDPSQQTGERFGLMLMVLSAASFAAMAALAKKLLPETPPQAVVLSRGVLMTTVFVALARRERVPLWGSHRSMLLLRGLLGYVALSCYFYSVQHLPLGDAVLLQYSHPIFIATVAPWLLQEATQRWHWPLVLAALLGVALIVGPSGDLRGSALVGLIGSICSGLAYMTVRQLSRREHPLTILIWFPLTTIPFSLIATCLEPTSAWPRTATEWLGHLAVAATALIGQFTLTAGLVRVGAARATAVTMTGPVFGLIFGFMLFATIPSLTSLLGTAIVVAAMILLARSRPAYH